MMPKPTTAATPAENCTACGKPAGICICDRVVPAEIGLRIVILQHPQEDDALLGTARLVALTFPDQCRIRTGLSWPSLAAATGDPRADRDRWPVLAIAKLPGKAAVPARPGEVLLCNRKGEPLDATRMRIDGLIVLDGTWSQAKTLWWRNAWLTKLPRLALKPRETSMYGRLREEPRRDWVSTLEAIADVLPALGEPETVRSELRRLLRTMLQRVRDLGPPS